MNSYHVEVSKVIAAPAETIYAVLADYEKGHPAILPAPYFTSMTVERGGQGAGTVTVVQMNVMGAKRRFRLETFEPEPGRVLEEVDEENGVVTRFVLDPLEDGSCLVTIMSDVQTKSGFVGFMEKMLTPLITRRIYQQELALLAEYVRG